MSYFEDRHIDFVLKHYKEGAFDAQKAIGRFRDAHGMSLPSRRRRASVMAWAVPAAAAVVLGVFLLVNRDLRQWTDVAVASVQQVVTLPDGTAVTLAPGTSLSYNMKDGRQVRMDGKAFFDVFRDESRPFEVEADGAFVRVLGTEFMVDVTDVSLTRVYVDEGKVLFARDMRSEGVVLTEGMAATLKQGSSLPAIEENPDVNVVAWHRGTFIFDQTPLKEVLSQLSEYYHVSFVTDDLSKCLSGEFHADDLDLIISLIESALDVNIIYR